MNTLGLKKYYNKTNDSLHLGSGVIPMKIACDLELRGVFNVGFSDIIYPLLPNTDGVMKLSFHEGPYEFDNVKIAPGDTVFDCGANVGFFSVMAANHKCTCYAFEPLPQNIKYLEKIIEVNSHITLVSYAVCDKVGTVYFETSERISSDAKIVSSDVYNSSKMECITLDYFAEKNKINRVDFIKVDIEGAERLLLKGAQGILKEYSPKLSICTYHLPDDSLVLRELILRANPKYIIKEKYKKMYAYVPE
ncbi:MAG: FkbM family methyltransferase [Syntrophorhabdaceae bacterium]|nr:FkbM family methyltransferase [Syntrophorhabdaceae bacterium]